MKLKRKELNGFLLRIITVIYRWVSRVCVILNAVISLMFLAFEWTTRKHELIFKMHGKNQKAKGPKARIRELLDYYECVLIQQQWFLTISFILSSTFDLVRHTRKVIMHLRFNLLPCMLSNPPVNICLDLDR